MFRKNYLPKLEVRKSSETGKWFAYRAGGNWGDDSFVETDAGYSLDPFQCATEYDTLELLMKSVYEYARIDHMKEIHRDLTYRQVKVSL